MKKILFSAVILTLISACAGIGGSPKAVEPIALTNAAVFAGQNKVLIGDFRVTFITFDKTSATAKSGMFSSDTGYASSSMKATLTGVPDDAMQAVTDAAYQDFIAGLKSNGYTIADESALTGNTTWQKIKQEASPIKNTSSFKMITGGSREDATFAPSGRTLMGRAIGGGTPYEAYDVANQLSTPILNVNYTVHFVYFGSETDYKSNSYSNIKGAEYSAEVSVGQGVHVTPGSGIDFMRGVNSTFSHPNGAVHIKAPVVIPGGYGTSEDSTSGMQKAANVFSSVLGAVSGGTSSTKEISVVANPGEYKVKASAALTEANKRVLGALAAAR
ncbi:hypothetical protein [uncultured Zhongshania sp.]|jgi:hypothetical protein|uniref:hypothetical protein n=1 Tax=uncultured Zhongshania sp. TaxID=1642288 RepID=UPI001B3CB511|nr:hypothetical protein [uncultured Zhongshania sp.]MBQ0761138.1 hypothetical protein [Zhongshania sp.]